MTSKKAEQAVLIVFLCALVAIGFFFRFKGIAANHPFWIDEFSSADQSRFLLAHGLSSFNNPLKYFEHHNITTYFLIGSSFKIFGLTESAARIPSVFIGSLIPLIVFFLSRYIFGLTTAIGASLFTTFSYFQIAWSRQARGYVLLQAIILLTLFLYYKLTDEKKRALPLVSAFILLVILGLLTHTFFLVLILSLTINHLLFKRKSVQLLLKSRLFYAVSLLALALLYSSNSLNAIVGNIYYVLSNPVNNLWYYHSFLWREYGLITFLGLIGLFLGFTQNSKKLAPIIIYVVLQLFFISFVWTHYISKYVLPIFPFFLMGMSYLLYEIVILFSNSKFISKYIQRLKNNKKDLFILTSYVLLILFILTNGHKFVIKPKSYYSVNHDFREIALLDYPQIYGLIKQKGRLEEGKTAVIDTWPGRVYWYIDVDYQPLYIFRWKNEKISVIGQKIQRTPFFISKEGNKIVPRNNNLRLLEDVADLKKVMKKHPRGFLYIDDESLPADVREYAKKNLKKELYLDRYPLEDNPYAVWPATLYSWGIK